MSYGIKLKQKRMNSSKLRPYNMNRGKAFIAIVGALLLIASCTNKGGNNTITATSNDETESLGDTTMYGICGENSAMHTVELIGDDGRIHQLMINPDDSISPVCGGLLAGDRLAVVAQVVYGDTIVQKAINLTTLRGRWVSIDKNFEIKEGGVVESHLEAETSPWSSWKIYNGHLLLNRDTFDVVALGADSLMIENENGLFGYKRVR